MDILIPILIIASLLMSVISGYRRGVLAVAAGLLSLLVGLVVAGIWFESASNLYEALRLNEAEANITAYLSLFALGQLIILILVYKLGPTFFTRFRGQAAGRIGGSVLGLLQAAAFISLILAILMELPLQPELRNKIASAPMAKSFIAAGQKLENLIGTVPAGDLTEALRLVPPEPQSLETIALRFKTTAVAPAPQLEERMLTLVNRERAQRGLEALEPNETARQVARKHSRDMLARGYFSHGNPEGETPFDRMKKGGVSYRAAGENLALAPTLAEAHIGLMNSPGHRANILSDKFGTVGIGIIDAGPYGVMVTQNFTD